MIVTAWNNGQHHSSGAGYGVKVNPMDRDKYFSHKWETILLKLEGNTGLWRLILIRSPFGSEVVEN
jgi:hypothetical protein